MEKPADNDHPILEPIRRRWSPRAFADRPVAPETLRSLLEAARWAPSSFNEQPWFFIVATREQAGQFERLLGCLKEGNRSWARAAPVLMLSVAKQHFDRTGKPNRHSWHDVGLAVENLVIQATSLDVFSHQMAGILPDRARQEFGIPEGYEPVAAIALGHVGDPASLPEDRRESELAPRSRRPLEEFVFTGSWGEPSELVAPD